MIKDLTSPRLIVDKALCEANIKRMVSKIDSGKSLLRPHFKTHQSAIIGEWYRASGISKITVSSLEMALFFFQEGWKDITIALPFNIHWIPIINKYGKAIYFNFLIEDVFVLNEIIKKIEYPCGLFVKIDLGYNRTGIVPDNYKQIDSLLALINHASKCEFKGFLGHAGHTYSAKNTDAIKEIYYNASLLMTILKNRYSKVFKDIITSYGDTPSCSIVENLCHFDEYRPGNFIFYDLMQYYLGSCKFDDIAIVMACPVLAKHELRSEIVVHCGAVHLSKDYIEVENQKVFGQLVIFSSDKSWHKPHGNAFVKSLSQEHGIIKAENDIFKQINIGDTVGIVPVHSCLTADVMGHEYNLKEVWST